MFVAPIRAPFPSPVASSGAAAVPWYLAGGVAAANCKAAYQPIGAASLAASYVNLANPGVNDAAPGTAPTHASATGWTFNGTTQYLTTGGLPADTKPVTMIVRGITTDVTDYRTWWGDSSTGGGHHLYHVLTSKLAQFTKGSVSLIGTGSSVVSTGVSHVVGVTYSSGNAWAFWLDGVADGSGTTSVTFTAGRTSEIGRGAGLYYFKGSIAAMAKYDAVLTDAQMLAVMTAMAALTG